MTKTPECTIKEGGERSPRFDVYLDIAPDSETTLKVVWRFGRPTKPYFVHKGQLLARAEECREALERLGKEYSSSTTPNYGPLLHELAKIGSLIHFLMFEGAADGIDTAEDCRAWFEEHEGDDIQLTISADFAVQIPWGLVYAGEPPAIPASGIEPRGPEDYPHFWGLKFSVATLCSTMPALWQLEKARRQAQFKLLLVLHESEYEGVLTLLSASEKEYFDRIVKRPIGSAFSWAAAREKWQSIADDDSLVYVLCHSDGKNLELDGKDKIDVTQFSKQFAKKRRGSHGLTLCFYNGCFTARGSLDNSFHVASQIPGFCGFVGTEAPIPPRLAGRFGLQFVYLLLECGLPVQEVVDRLRMAHWPLGLLYSCYADPRFWVEAPRGDIVDIGIAQIANAPRRQPARQQ